MSLGALDFGIITMEPLLLWELYRFPVDQKNGLEVEVNFKESS